MRSIPVSRAKLIDIVGQVEEDRQPIRLTARNFSVVVIGSAEWLAIEETLYRLSSPDAHTPPVARGRGEPLRPGGGPSVRSR